MNKLEVIDNKKIESMIYEIRGVQVMLDSDLARVYNCKNGTKSINLAVKRHINRFPERFMFQLTEEEYTNLRFQIETTNMTRTLPYAFTEQGVAMLSAILKTDVAEKMSIKIMDAFVTMRRFLSSNLLEQNFYKNKILEHDERIKLLEDNFSNKTFSNEPFYDGEVYDAYSLLLKIINSANKSIIIIDNYISSELLDILSKTNKDIIIYSKNINTTLINKYNSQYHNITFNIDTRFHDRFIILDEK